MAFSAQGGEFRFLLEVLIGVCPFFFHFLKKAEVFSGELRGLGGGGQREGMGDICDSVNNKKRKELGFS